jgi:hypothetical protein
MPYPDSGVIVGRIPGPGANSPFDTTGIVVPTGNPRGPLGQQDAVPTQTKQLKKISEPAPRNDDLSWGILLIRHSLDLFENNKDPEFSEVRQGGVHNCPLPAFLAAMVHTNTFSNKIKISETKQKVKSDHSDKTRYPDSNKTPNLDKDETNRFFTVEFPGSESAEVTDFLWSDKFSTITYAHSSKSALWVSLVEKAFVRRWVTGGYETLADANTGPDANEVIEHMFGSADAVEVQTLKDAEIIVRLTKAKTVPTIARSKADDANLAHAYTVLGLKGDKVELFNALSGKTEERTLASFKARFDYLLYP